MVRLDNNYVIVYTVDGDPCVPSAKMYSGAFSIDYDVSVKAAVRYSNYYSEVFVFDIEYTGTPIADITESHIEVDVSNAKLIYFTGETFDFESLVVTLYFTDGSFVFLPPTDCEIIGFIRR